MSVSVAGAQALLEHRDVGVSHVDVPCVGWPIGDVLQQSAQEGAPVLLVSGAYGRGRFRELVLGGATGSALHGARLPFFMSP
jgi:nucleotide-binding universal stress UspA family protein